MICHPCRQPGGHNECINYLKVGIALSTWCDCQHREDQAEVTEQANQNQARIAAVIARRIPRPTSK